MPAKKQITRETLLKAAVDIIRKGGGRRTEYALACK